MKTITKKDIAAIVAAQTNLTQSEVKEVIEAVLNEIKGQFQKGNQVTLRGFGTFLPHYRKECYYRDPSSGEKKLMEARYTLRFKTSKNLFIFCDKKKRK